MRRERGGCHLRVINQNEWMNDGAIFVLKTAGPRESIIQFPIFFLLFCLLYHMGSINMAQNRKPKETAYRILIARWDGFVHLI